jgi:hypothetical protein
MDPFEAIRKERKTGTVYCGTTKDAKGSWRWRRRSG